MAEQQPQPRRRQADKDRRRWSDPRLDDFRETTERRLDDHDHFVRTFSQVAGLMNGIQEQLEETQKDVRELRAENRRLFERNFTEHKEVQQTADRIAQNVKPTRMSKTKDFVTYVSVLIVPFLLTYLTIVLAHGGTP